MASTNEMEKKMNRMFVTLKAVFHLITNSSHCENDLNFIIRMAKTNKNFGIHNRISEMINVGMYSLNFVMSILDTLSPSIVVLATLVIVATNAPHVNTAVEKFIVSGGGPFSEMNQ